MDKTIIAEGKTTNEAIEKGLEILKVSRDKVDIKVLEEEKKSFYSILAPRVVKVELKIKENISEESKPVKEKKSINENMEEIEAGKGEVEKFLKSFLSEENKYEVEIKDFQILVNITGKNINSLIGYRGETINALQIIMTAIANKNRKSPAKIRVILDIEGYRKKREKTLEELAEKIARTVIRTRKSISLEPMSAYERKIIHEKLQNSSKVKTESKGEEPYRKVVISLKK